MLKNLKLYAKDYFNQAQYKTTPEYLDIETIEVSNTYDDLTFLLRMKPKPKNKDEIPF